jgi:hypothetical protein
MYDLLHEDISGFKPGSDRPTSGLARYKTQTASAFDQWLEDCLRNAEIRRNYAGHDCYIPWAGSLSKNAVYDAYAVAARGKRGDALSDSLFWGKMREVGLVASDSRKSVQGERVRCIEVVPLGVAREKFGQYMAEGEALWEHATVAPPYPCEECERKREAQDGEQTPF